MPEITAQKCSVRRTALRRVQQLVNELIQLNEAADRTRAALVAAGSADVGDSVNKILAAAGPSSITSVSSNDTLVDEIFTMLMAADGNAVGWSYLAE